MYYKIYWKRVSNRNYLYGSSIHINGRKIRFYNELMPPSLVIQEWNSLSSYQSNHLQPDLPLLKKGSLYQISSYIELVPEKSLYVRIEFFDRFSQLIDFKIFKEMTGQFRYPESAYSYRIQLVNAGCQSIEFDHLLLQSCS